MRSIRLLALVAMVALGAAACTGGGSTPQQDRSSRNLPFPIGGTLRLAMFLGPGSLDPSRAYNFATWEYFRCCLLRTLLSYNGSRTDQGGAVAKPDLVSSQPQVSSDGLDWTFHIKRGIHYAPPFAGTEIIAQDFVRALERVAWVNSGPRLSKDPGESGYPFYFSVIEGFEAFRKGHAQSISGLTAPDPHTLKVHLTQPAGDLGYRFSLPATAPIPPWPGHRAAMLGAATGHDSDWGRFLVASGPYMLQGSQDLDFSQAPQRQRPAPGYVPGKSIDLVRNRSWHPSTDGLRSAYVDEIRATIDIPPTTRAYFHDLNTWAHQVGHGRLDMLFDAFNGGSPRQYKRAARSPGLPTVHADPEDSIYYITMNLAQPPFDDVHVRKAVNFVLDKTSLVDRDPLGGLAGTVATHIGLDSQEQNQLLTFDPYRTPGHRGSLSAARKEMRRSRYDRNGDGICDVAACQNILAPSHVNAMGPGADRMVARDLSQIGINLRLKPGQDKQFYPLITDPSNHVAMGIGAVWGTDYPNGSGIFGLLFSFHPPIQFVSPYGQPDYSLVGASPRQLRRWGYRVRHVPNVDGRINQCMGQVGLAQTTCWSGLDKYLMEKVVPLVPYENPGIYRITSNRLAHYSFDQFARMPALDQIALKPSTIAGSS